MNNNKKIEGRVQVMWLLLVLTVLNVPTKALSQAGEPKVINLEKDDTAPFDEKFTAQKNFNEEVKVLSVNVYETTNSQKLLSQSYRNIKMGLEMAIEAEIKYVIKSKSFYKRLRFVAENIEGSSSCDGKLSRKQIKELNDSIKFWKDKYEDKLNLHEIKSSSGFSNEEPVYTKASVTACFTIGQEVKVETKEETKEGKTSLLINSQPLPPGKFYNFVIVTAPANKDITSLHNISDSLFAASKLNQPFRSKLESKTKLEYRQYFSDLNHQNSLGSDSMRFEVFKAIYVNRILPNLIKIHDAEDTLITISKSLKKTDLISVKCANKLKDLFLSYNSSEPKFKYLTHDLKAISNTVANLSNYTAFNENYIKGSLKISNDYTDKPVKLNEYAVRVKNIEESLVLIDQLIRIANILSDSDINECLINLNILRNKFFLATKKIKLISSLRKVISDLLVAEPLLAKAFISGTNTFVYDLKTRAGYSIFPDLGILYADRNLFESDGPLFSETTFSPYLGFVVNFRPINQKIPFKRGVYPGLTRFSKHRWTFNSGLALTSLKREGEVEDFFKERSLLTGLGYRLGGGVTLHSGGVWFRRLDPNPLINRKKLGASPYLSLSVDIKLKDFLNGLSSIF